jgi:hypothetical protein
MLASRTRHSLVSRARPLLTNQAFLTIARSTKAFSKYRNLELVCRWFRHFQNLEFYKRDKPPLPTIPIIEFHQHLIENKVKGRLLGHKRTGVRDPIQEKPKKVTLLRTLQPEHMLQRFEHVIGFERQLS